MPLPRAYAIPAIAASVISAEMMAMGVKHPSRLLFICSSVNRRHRLRRPDYRNGIQGRCR